MGLISQRYHRATKSILSKLFLRFIFCTEMKKKRALEIERRANFRAMTSMSRASEATTCPISAQQLHSGKDAEMETPRWRRWPEGSNWGDFGPDDQWGRLNLITREKLRQGLAEATEGIAFCLRLTLDHPRGNPPNPRRYPPILRPTVRDGRPNFNCVIEGSDGTDVFNDDLAILW